MNRILQATAGVFLCLVFLVSSGCHKKHQVQPEQQTSQAPGEADPSQPVADMDTSGTGQDASRLELAPVFFDYDRFEIRDDQEQALRENAKKLRENENLQVLLEGHCDERGTDEYNLALGDRRARTVKQYLVDLGVSEGRIRTISYGESQPFALGHDEAAWQQNRRAQPLATSPR